MKSRFLNVLGMSFTNFKWTPTIDIFRRRNVVHTNTPFLWPIMFFQWNIKYPHEVSNHWSEFSNIWIWSISPWRMGLCGVFINKVPSALICPFPPPVHFLHCPYSELVELLLTFSNIARQSHFYFPSLRGIHSTYLIQFPWMTVNDYDHLMLYL